MKTKSRVLFGIFTLALIGMLNAASVYGTGKSPESIVVCGFGGLPGVLPAYYGGLYTVLGHSNPSAVDMGQCRFGETPDLCTVCILSLESQGCKVLETVTDNFAKLNASSGGMTHYMMSCSKP